MKAAPVDSRAVGPEGQLERRLSKTWCVHLTEKKTAVGVKEDTGEHRLKDDCEQCGRTE